MTERACVIALLGTLVMAWHWLQATKPGVSVQAVGRIRPIGRSLTFVLPLLSWIVAAALLGAGFGILAGLGLFIGLITLAGIFVLILATLEILWAQHTARRRLR